MRVRNDEELLITSVLPDRQSVLAPWNGSYSELFELIGALIGNALTRWNAIPLGPSASVEKGGTKRARVS